MRHAQSKEAAALQESVDLGVSMQRVESEKAVLQAKLSSAQKLVKQVMAEGGALLDTFQLKFSEIDFHAASNGGERHRLGEGSKVNT